METAIVYWGYIGIMEKKMESGKVAYRTRGFHRSTSMFGCRGDAACVVTPEAMCPKQLIRTTLRHNQVIFPSSAKTYFSYITPIYYSIFHYPNITPIYYTSSHFVFIALRKPSTEVVGELFPPTFHPSPRAHDLR